MLVFCLLFVWPAILVLVMHNKKRDVHKEFTRLVSRIYPERKFMPQQRIHYPEWTSYIVHN